MGFRFYFLMEFFCFCFLEQIVVDMHMSVLSLRDGDSGAGSGAYKSPNSCHGVVHFSNPMLI